MFFCTLRDLVLYLHKDEHGFNKKQVRKHHPIAVIIKKKYIFINSSLQIQNHRYPIMCTMRFLFIIHWQQKPPITRRNSMYFGFKPLIKLSIYSKPVIQRNCNRGSIRSIMFVQHFRRHHLRVVSAAKNVSNGLFYPIHIQSSCWFV